MLVSSRSSTTTSGLCCSTNCRTSVPSVVQAATLMSGSPSSRARSPSSTIAWSSASSTRTTSAASPRGQGDGRGRAAPGGALERESAAQHLPPILDAPQAEVPALHSDVLFAREHALGVEALALVGDGQADGTAAPLEREPQVRRPGMSEAVCERLLQDAVDRDLGRQGAVAHVRRQVELDPTDDEGLLVHA